MHSARNRTPFFRTLALVSVLGGAACKPSEAPPPAAPPAVEVGTITVQPSSIPVLDELPGRIAPTRSAEVRPRVSGIIVERVFRQGGSVKAGDVLFKLDASMYEVERASARAVLAKAEVTAAEARQQAERGDTLLASGVVTQEQHETLQAALRRAEADVAAARAAVRRAELNLEYTTIRAPIGGRIGRALVTEGALVSAGEPTALALIQQLDPVYVDFTQPAMELRRLRQAFKDGRIQGSTPEQANIQLVLDDGSLYAKAGRLLFSDVTVDPGSGQVTVRGEFPNPDAELLPGMYVRGRIEQGTLSEALAVPQQAIQRDNAGKSQVFVVARDGTAEVRPVRVSRVYQEQAVIQEGLKAGDQVIVDGFQKIAAGAPVKPVAWTAPGTGINPSQPR
ncbi:efflux RND transporter periplasmic adaptor subunit [Archangium violaceum]|uniref:efflux RND transporter periplasmic adaptor subunit n=1 Tax=Archangium violaceum TaxID=83451 RepID=UPI00193B70A2|nr:efflux RND transporter periplasmic adaptor subunit [Archangium violaceum]QRK11356.1 efflux RND transporter periplasmic adaptor subunit [Archangium violaceum]